MHQHHILRRQETRQSTVTVLRSALELLLAALRCLDACPSSGIRPLTLRAGHPGAVRRTVTPHDTAVQVQGVTTTLAAYATRSCRDGHRLADCPSPTFREAQQALDTFQALLQEVLPDGHA